MHIPILYEDNHLIIVEKPINIPVQQDDTNDPDLLTILKQDIKTRYNKPGNVYLSLLHRLDRPVGGAIVFAKTSKAASRMSDLFRKKDIERGYLAVVRRQVKKEADILVHYLWKDQKKNMVFAKKANDKEAKKAILHYHVVARQSDLTLVKVKLETGRSHQIRVQFQQIDHPLYGDQKYGPEVNKKGQQIALWAHTLSFIHPVTKERITVKSEPPNKHPWNIWNEPLLTSVQ
ncbi:RluA family pseudouridine synthase [Metasolibacillus sp. FSL H7-0170]|uniref:RluA family pseudouridine synthase n=1 Tax=Metasolibacillus TaxID=2703677 RepID=UPI00079399FE|nr:RluA family pseudouridine synthase [Metasolibacillus fluoroglycofenilyticus]KYG91828.1 RNA pseudouridine synthase [[Bacillus] sp. KCTC 13219]